MAKNWPLLRVASCPGLVGQGKDLARGGDKSVRWRRESDTHLVQIGQVRVSAAKPGSGLVYRDGEFLEIIVRFERGSVATRSAKEVKRVI